MKNTLPTPLALLFLLCSLTACQDDDPQPDGDRSDQFQAVPERYPIAPDVMDEASGLVDSRSIPGYLWVQQDGGNAVELFLLSHDGKDIRRYPLPGATNVDWEDIAMGGGPEDGLDYIYLGDIGNNDGNTTSGDQAIYRVPELRNLDGSFTPDQVAAIRFRYPDGTPDAETLLLDPDTKDIFVVSKEFGNTRLYRLPYPQSTRETITAELVGQIPSLLLATGGDISADGQEILIRTYTHVYYWKRIAGESIGQTLLREADKPVPYTFEPQGEAVCFDRDMKGYFTLSERRAVPEVSLQYFGRK